MVPNNMSQYSRDRSKQKLEYFAYVLDVFEDERVIKRIEFKDKRRIEKKVRVFGKIAQVIGEQYFMLFEVLLKPEANVSILDKVYIGPGPKAKVDIIIQKVTYENLTSIAKTELENAVTKIIKSNEEKWIKFLNTAGPITPKLHILELLPHIGKKKMWQIIREREIKPFESFEDFLKRTGIDPIKAIAGRVMEEIMNDQKYYLFVVKPSPKPF